MELKFLTPQINEKKNQQWLFTQTKKSQIIEQIKEVCQNEKIPYDKLFTPDFSKNALWFILDLVKAAKKAGEKNG